jgi:signal transduction histidine kinase
MLANGLVAFTGRLRQVLTNLLTNSIKFTSEGSIALRATEEFEDEDIVRVRFSIEDEGVGIADSIRQRLFQPFSQADSSTARRYGGTGLGLTISKNVSARRPALYWSDLT